MTILNPEDTEQEFIIIPRSYNGLNLYLVFTDEQTKQTHSKTVLALDITADWYDMVTFTTTLNFLYENAFFDLVIKSSTQEVIYKDIIFCTSQNTNRYSVNDGEYILPTINNNNYIVIE
jgi:hypothetical protein